MAKRKLQLSNINSLKDLGRKWLRSPLMWKEKKSLLRVLGSEVDEKVDIPDGSYWIVRVIKRHGRATISVVTLEGHVSVAYIVSPRALMELRAVKRWYPGASGWIEMILDYSDAIESEGREGDASSIMQVERAIAEAER